MSSRIETKEREDTQKRRAFCAALPQPLYDRLNELARKTDRSCGNIARRALEHYFSTVDEETLAR